MFKQILEIFSGRKGAEVTTGDDAEEELVETVTPPSRRKLAHNAVERLMVNSEKRDKINYRKAGEVTVVCCRNNLLDFYEHLVEINEFIESGITLRPADVFSESTNYTVKDLMIRNNFYLPYDVVKYFCEQANKLCQQLEESDDRTSGQVVHNCRVLTMQLGSIREVCDALNKCFDD